MLLEIPQKIQMKFKHQHSNFIKFLKPRFEPWYFIWLIILPFLLKKIQSFWVQLQQKYLFIANPQMSYQRRQPRREEIQSSITICGLVLVSRQQLFVHHLSAGTGGARRVFIHKISAHMKFSESYWREGLIANNMGGKTRLNVILRTGNPPNRFY